MIVGWQPSRSAHSGPRPHHDPPPSLLPTCSPGLTTARPPANCSALYSSGSILHQHYKHAAHRGQKSAKTSDSSYQTHLQQPQGPGSRPEPDLRTRFGEDCDQRSPGGDECAKQPYIPRRQPIKPRSATRQHRPSTWPRPMAANVEDAIISSRKIVINRHSTAAEPTRCEQPAWLVSMHRTGRERPVWRA